MKKQEREAIDKMIQDLKRKPELFKAQRKMVQYHAEKRRMEEQRNRKNELNRIIDETVARNAVPHHYPRRRGDLMRMIKDSLPYL